MAEGFTRGPVYKEQFYINSQIWCHYPLCQSINWRICFSIVTSNLMARRKGLGDMLNLLFTHLLEWFLRSSISQQWPNLQSYTSIGVGFRCILLETRNVTRHLQPVWWRWKLLSCIQLHDLMDYRVHGIFQAKILELVAVPFSRVSSQPRDQTQVSCITGRFFTSWATKKARSYKAYSWLKLQLFFLKIEVTENC